MNLHEFTFTIHLKAMDSKDDLKSYGISKHLHAFDNGRHLTGRNTHRTPLHFMHLFINLSE